MEIKNTNTNPLQFNIGAGFKIMRNFFLKFIELCRDLFFPKKCIDCNKEGEWWCREHRHFLDNEGIWRCPICKIENKTGATCSCCKRETYLDGVISFLPFFEPSPLSELLHDYKYNFVKDLENLWEEMIGKNKVFTRENFWLQENVVFTPVPLHPLRERWRGFNQAQILLRIFLRLVKEKYPTQDFVFDDLLERIKKTQQQAKLKKEDRLSNIKDAFKIKKISPKRVILIDDVFTSGATLSEAAKTLKQAGAQEVWALTLFRAE